MVITYVCSAGWGSLAMQENGRITFQFLISHEANFWIQSNHPKTLQNEVLEDAWQNHIAACFANARDARERCRRSMRLVIGDSTKLPQMLLPDSGLGRGCIECSWVWPSILFTHSRSSIVSWSDTPTGVLANCTSRATFTNVFTERHWNAEFRTKGGGDARRLPRRAKCHVSCGLWCSRPLFFHETNTFIQSISLPREDEAL